MEYLIQTLGAKFCCIFASGCGGAANVLTKKQFNLRALKDVALAVIVGWFAQPVLKTMTYVLLCEPHGFVQEKQLQVCLVIVLSFLYLHQLA